MIRTPGLVLFGTCICSNAESILSWTCHVYGPYEVRTSLGTSILLRRFHFIKTPLVTCTFHWSGKIVPSLFKDMNNAFGIICVLQGRSISLIVTYPLLSCLFYISITCWVSLLVDQWVRIIEGTCSQVLRSILINLESINASKLSVLKLIEIVLSWVYYTFHLASACFDIFEISHSNFWKSFIF